MHQSAFPHPDIAAAGRHDAWRRLAEELDAWAAAGRRATFWWRDDDATAPSQALDRLLAVAAGHGVPLVLAVIPAAAGTALAERLSGEPRQVTVLQHGWAHRNHAPKSEKKQELGSHRPADAVLDELDTGRRRLHALFGQRFRPVLVPPWNRAADAVTARLAAAGLTGVSSFGPRRRGRTAAPNTHIDIVDWRGGSGFAGLEACLDAACRHLAARRAGDADPDEATGLLTHHLDHDEACWAFVADFLAATRGHPGADWPGPDALFAGAAP